MDDFDIPIFKKSYELYKSFYVSRLLIPKQDRYTIWQRSENLILDLLEGILLASQAQRARKFEVLENTSVKLNLLRVFVRLMKETKAIEARKYVAFEVLIDEIGRMLGGWIKSVKDK